MMAFFPNLSVQIYNHLLFFFQDKQDSDLPRSEIINGPYWMYTTICQKLVNHIGGRGNNFFFSSEV